MDPLKTPSTYYSYVEYVYNSSHYCYCQAYITTLEPGDIVYGPARWFHQVSDERNELWRICRHARLYDACLNFLDLPVFAALNMPPNLTLKYDSNPLLTFRSRGIQKAPTLDFIAYYHWEY